HRVPSSLAHRRNHTPRTATRRSTNTHPRPVRCSKSRFRAGPGGGASGAENPGGSHVSRRRRGPCPGGRASIRWRGRSDLHGGPSCPRGRSRRNCSPPPGRCPMSTARAAVLNAIREPLSVEPLAVRDPRDGEVLVRLAASGVCHSDLHAITGDLPMPLPCVLGHEGAGVVEAVGAGVRRVQPKDHVVLNWVPFCGSCWYCNSGNAYLCEMGYVKAMTAEVFHRNGTSIKQFGSTHTVYAGSTDPVTAVLDLTGMRVADYAFEVIGRPEVVTQAFMAIRRGEKAVVNGQPPATDMVSVPGVLLPLAEKSLVG